MIQEPQLRMPVLSQPPTSRPTAASPRTARVVAVITASFFVGIDTIVVGATVRPADGLLLLFLGIVAARSTIRGTIPRVRFIPELVVLFVYFFYRVVNAAILTSATSAVIWVIQAVEIILLVLSVAYTTRQPESRRAFLSALLVSLGLIATYTVYYHVRIGSYFDFKSLDDPKLTFGVVAILWFSSGNGRQIVDLPDRLRRWLLPVLLGLLVLSGDRKGWVAFAAAAILISWLPAVRRHVKRRDARRFYSLVLGLACIALAVPLVTPYAANRVYTARQIKSLAEVPNLLRAPADISSASTGSNYSRAFILQQSVKIFWTSPITGIGIDRFRDAIAGPAAAYGAQQLNPHNEYIKAGVETGIIGLSLLLTLTLMLVRRGWRLAKDLGVRNARSIEGGRVIAGLIFYGVFVNLFLAGGVLNLWFLTVPLGLVLGAWQEEFRMRRERSATNLPA